MLLREISVERATSALGRKRTLAVTEEIRAVDPVDTGIRGDAQMERQPLGPDKKGLSGQNGIAG